MTSTYFATPSPSVSTGAAVDLADELEVHGWTVRRPRLRAESALPQVVRLRPPLGSTPVELMVVTYPDDGGQLAEFTCEPVRGTGKWSTGSRHFWRMSIFDAPVAPTLAAARAAARQESGPTFDTAGHEGWEVCLTRSVSGHLESSSFVHPTGQVVAEYHYPVAPGECGGWLITAPGSYADATGHTPGPVVREFAESLLTR